MFSFYWSTTADESPARAAPVNKNAEVEIVVAFGEPTTSKENVGRPPATTSLTEMAFFSSVSIDVAGQSMFDFENKCKSVR